MFKQLTPWTQSYCSSHEVHFLATRTAPLIRGKMPGDTHVETQLSIAEKKVEFARLKRKV